MALVKENKDFPFAQGVDTKTDQKLSVKPSRIENAVFRGGTIQKPYGTTALTNALDTGGNLGAGEGIFSFDSELVRLNNGGCYSFGQGASKWSTKPGSAGIVTHNLKRITRRSSSQVDFDHVYVVATGVTVTSWIDNGLHVAVYDEATGDFYQTGATAIPGTGSSSIGSRCINLGGTVLVFCAGSSGASLECAIVNTSSPSSTPTLVTLETDVTLGTSSNTWDAVGLGSSYAIAGYRSNSTGHLTLIAVNSAGTVLGSPAKTNTGLAVTALSPLCMHLDGNNVVYVVVPPSAEFATFSSSTFAAVSSGFVATGTGIAPLLAAFAEVNPGVVTIFMSGAPESPTVGIQTLVVSSTAVTTAAATLNGTRGLVLQSDGFLVNGFPAVLIMNDVSYAGVSVLQPTGWVIDINGNVLAKILPGRAFNPHTTPVGGILCRPFVGMNGGTAVLIGEQGRTTYTSQAGNIITTTPGGCTRVNLVITKASQVPALRFGGAVYIGGSQPRIYDGQEIVEAGHNVFPEGGSAVASTGSNLTPGQYQYKLVFSWMNARGEIQRSIPSPAITINIAAGANQAATITFPTQRLCGRDLVGISKTQLEVYRTESNGQNFYRASSVTSPLINDITVATLNFNDNSVTDAQLINNELLYTTGGVNDNPAPPAFTLACDHETRMAIAGLENPFEYRTSSVTINGEMLRWNESWGGFVPQDTGPITGIASMDGNLFLFTQYACYLVSGDGPDLLGNNNWRPPQRVMSVDSGPVGTQSLVVAPDGIWFQALKGISRLGRDLSFVYVGADVEAYGMFTFREAVLRPEYEQIWFHIDQGNDATFGQGIALVWDYHYGQWSVLTGAIGATFGAQDTCYWNGSYMRVNASGTILQESTATFQQNGTYISTVAETQWIKLAALLGYERLYYITLLGTYFSDFTLTWDVAYDYAGTAPAVPTYTETVTLVGNGLFSAGGPYQVRHHSGHACAAVKFRFTDSAIGDGGQGMGLSALNLEWGTKRGARKLPANQSM